MITGCKSFFTRGAGTALEFPQPPSVELEALAVPSGQPSSLTLYRKGRPSDLCRAEALTKDCVKN